VIDKPTAIIANILDYYGVQIDEPVAAPSTTGWTNTSYEGANYPYKQNYTKAVDYLASAGFWGDGTWLHYPNATQTIIVNGTAYTGAQVWGTAAGKTTQNVAGGEPLVVVIRGTDPIRLALGRYVCSQLDGEDSGPTASVLYANPEWAVWGEAHGEPNLKGGAFGTTDHTYEGLHGVSDFDNMVSYEHNYNLYTGGWTVGRFPTYDYGLYDTSFWYPYGANYVTGTSWAIGNPDYSTTQDTYLHNLYYAPTLADSLGNCTLFNGYFVEWCESIMLWSTANYNAWSRNIQSVTNMQGTGIINDYTFMNAYKSTGGPILVGEPESWTWDAINPLYSAYYFEQDYLSRIVGGTMSVSPYNITTDQPWMAQDWKIGTWFDPRTNQTKTAVTYWFRKDCGCAAPVTGAFAGNFTAMDFAANIWYTYAYSDAWQWTNTMDINHVIINNPYEATVYFDDFSIWFADEPTYPMMMPASVLTADTQLCAVKTTTFSGSNLTALPSAMPGYLEYKFTNASVVSVISATKDGIPITEGVDYYVRTGYDQTARDIFVPITSFAPTDNISITYYYAIPGAASGTYLGSAMVGSSGVPATMYSYSYLYPQDLSATSSLLVQNPYFFLKTRILGEIDWVWYWQGATQPRSGYYKIDMHDLAYVIAALNTSGVGPYNPKYFPGADLSPYFLLGSGDGRGRITWADIGFFTLDGDFNHDGNISILDIVALTSRYGTHTGEPGYNIYYDLNLDGKIDILDVVTLAGNYGRKAPNPILGKTFGTPPP
jgi:hypothetical protein